MVAGILSYKPEVFTCLPELGAAEAKFKALKGSLALKELGKIFSQFGQQQHFGLILLHRHYSQDADEITVETVFDSSTISTPWRFSADKLLKPTDFENSKSLSDVMNETKTPSVDEIYPHSWKFNRDGSISPYEFLASAEGDKEVELPEGFLSALHQKLKEFGLEDVLGLHWVHRGTNVIAVESSLENQRANILQLKAEPTPDDLKDTINVLWGFWDPLGDPVQACRCKLNMGQHTGWHF